MSHHHAWDLPSDSEDYHSSAEYDDESMVSMRPFTLDDYDSAEDEKYTDDTAFVISKRKHIDDVLDNPLFFSDAESELDDDESDGTTQFIESLTHHDLHVDVEMANHRRDKRHHTKGIYRPRRVVSARRAHINRTRHPGVHSLSHRRKVAADVAVYAETEPSPQTFTGSLISPENEKELIDRLTTPRQPEEQRISGKEDDVINCTFQPNTHHKVKLKSANAAISNLFETDPKLAKKKVDGTLKNVGIGQFFTRLPVYVEQFHKRKADRDDEYPFAVSNITKNQKDRKKKGKKKFNEGSWEEFLQRQQSEIEKKQKATTKVIKLGPEYTFKPKLRKTRDDFGGFGEGSIPFMERMERDVMTRKNDEKRRAASAANEYTFKPQINLTRRMRAVAESDYHAHLDVFQRMQFDLQHKIARQKAEEKMQLHSFQPTLNPTKKGFELLNKIKTPFMKRMEQDLLDREANAEQQERDKRARERAYTFVPDTSASTREHMKVSDKLRKLTNTANERKSLAPKRPSTARTSTSSRSFRLHKSPKTRHPSVY